MQQALHEDLVGEVGEQKNAEQHQRIQRVEDRAARAEAFGPVERGPPGRQPESGHSHQAPALPPSAPAGGACARNIDTVAVRSKVDGSRTRFFTCMRVKRSGCGDFSILYMRSVSCSSVMPVSLISTDSSR